MNDPDGRPAGTSRPPGPGPAPASAPTSAPDPTSVPSGAPAAAWSGRQADDAGHRRQIRFLVILAVGVVALVAAGAAIMVYVTGDITIRGAVYLAASGYTESTDDCAGSGDLADMHEGLVVLVLDHSGATVGEGHLGTGEVVRGAPSRCRMPFEVQTSGGPSSYDIQLGRRTPVQVSRNRIDQGEVKITLP